jgi:hypothetical protein
VQDHGTEVDEEANKILFRSFKIVPQCDLTYDKFVNYDGKELFKHRRLGHCCRGYQDQCILSGS